MGGLGCPRYGGYNMVVVGGCGLGDSFPIHPTIVRRVTYINGWFLTANVGKNTSPMDATWESKGLFDSNIPIHMPNMTITHNF